MVIIQILMKMDIYLTYTTDSKNMFEKLYIFETSSEVLQFRVISNLGIVDPKFNDFGLNSIGFNKWVKNFEH